MKRLILLPAVAVVVGCAAPQYAQPYRPPPAITESPRCSDQVTCERMWQAAQQAVESLTGMRLRMVTDTRIETFAPTSYGRTGAIVMKYPLGDGAYELRADFECYRSTDCSDIRPLGINAFNSRVKLSAR